MSQEQERLEWLDVLKGVAIFLVVLGHSGESSIKGCIYAFHMPLFFMLAGYTSVLSYDKNKDALIFAKKKLFSLFIPMMTWGVFGVLFFASRARFLNYSMIDGLRHCVTGDVFVWFIPALLCLQGLYLVYELAARKIKGLWRVSLILGLVTALFLVHRQFGRSGCNGLEYPIDWLTNAYVYSMPYIIGCAMRKYGKKTVSPQFGGGWILTVSIIASLLFWRQVAGFWVFNGNYVLAVVGSCISYSLIVMFANMKIYPWFSRQATLIGRHTLIIYLSSGIFLAVGYFPLARDSALLSGVVYGATSLIACYACVFLSLFIDKSPLLGVLLLGKPMRRKKMSPDA